MKITLKIVLSFFVFLLVFLSCDDIDDKPAPSSLEIKDFIWKGLNLYYFWQGQEPNLADDRFATQRDLNAFNETFASPEALFEDLLVERSTDRYSVIFSDYRVLEGILTGTSKSNGVDYGLKRITPGSNEIYGWVRYILPSSDASSKPIQRGDIFYAVNGTPLTVDNYNSLLSNDTYTLNLADFNGGNISPNGQSVTLTKTDYAENPVYLTNVYDYGDKKIGYLIYNGFFTSFENQLNQAIGQLKNQGITHLILDLRYNSGGSVDTATRLASMITGQFNNDVFARQQWNQKVEDYLNQNDPSSLVNRFTNVISNGNLINNLNLNKIYIITSPSTASASELIINGLKPHISVVQIGTKTEGKNVGSITLYDSPTFGKSNRNNNHRYAMQPIVLRIANKLGEGDYVNGLSPNVPQDENIANLGTLGDVNEPLLNTTINYILEFGRPRATYTEDGKLYFKDRKSMLPYGNEMYLNDVPQGLFQILQ
ncbi:S41 family peptidase [Flavobacterium filum]|uniref:S41 family peptidase n=1 Tax=Flavobacterium filum TaxID=370974 RepID=UPI0023F24602|nr:S41 family peptidase [Flavobacterium filum]